MRLGDPDHEHRTAGGGQHAVAVVQARGGRPACSCARCRRPGVRPTRARSAPRCRRRRRRNRPRPCAGAPRRPPRTRSCPVAATHEVQPVTLISARAWKRRSERADTPGLIGAKLRLVRGQRRHGDVVLARKGMPSPPASSRAAASRSARRRRHATAGSRPFCREWTRGRRTSSRQSRCVAAGVKDGTGRTSTDRWAGRPLRAALDPPITATTMPVKSTSDVRSNPGPPSPREPPERRVAALLRARG